APNDEFKLLGACDRFLNSGLMQAQLRTWGKRSRSLPVEVGQQHGAGARHRWEEFERGGSLAAELRRRFTDPSGLKHARLSDLSQHRTPD
ncbi:Hypothetical predicted protein, partial [Marmota monax]